MENITNLKYIYKNIIESKSVSIFIHENPDCDALGSAFGLKTFLLEKKIKCEIISLDLLSKKFKYPLLIELDRKKVSDAYIKKSTGIILDTANSARILGQRHILCNKLFRIDHHPHIENIGQREWIDINFSSTSEMVGWFLLENNKKISPKICNFLYSGILTDSGKFMYPSTSKKTFQLIERFFDFKFDKQKIQEKIFLRSFSDMKDENFLRNKIKITKDGIGYIIVKKTHLHKIKSKSPNNYVYLMSNIHEIKVWFILYFDKKNKVWKGSLRSRELNISEIASKFNGGGHKNASGFKLKNIKELKLLISEISLKI